MPTSGTYVYLTSWITISVLLALAGLWIVRRFISHELLLSHHDVAGSLLSIVGTLYAIILGLVVVGSLNTFQQARISVAQEANSLRALFHLAEGLPTLTEQQIRQDCLSYATLLIHNEWKTMEVGKPSLQAVHIMRDLWRTVVSARD
jgi:hypothetical protein